MYDVPGSGKHHKREGHRNSLQLTMSDVRWIVGVLALPTVLGLVSFLPHALVWIALILVVALGALTVRLMRHTGDHHFTSSPKDEAPEKPVEVYEVTVLPSPEDAEAQVRAQARTLAVMATVSGALLAFARHSQRQADKSRVMHDEIDEQLGLPGTRLGYGVRYQENRPKPPVWEQPVITGLNWRERQARQIEDGHVRRVGGEPGKTDGSWQNG